MALTTRGKIHPITSAINEIHSIMNELGFAVAMGPEMETEYYNFDALNIPADHPARDMQDTFWLKQSGLGQKYLLRTHTSPVQIRYMENHKPPLRIIVPGKVFRNEATDATHETQFHQIEGLLVDKETSVAELKGTLSHLFKKFLGSQAVVEFRPSYFPFVEPGFEVFVTFKGKWLEVMGAGLVHQNVLRSVNLDPLKWKAFAFGGGIDRLVMIKYGIDDVRLLYNGDLRLVNQFDF